MEKSEQHQIHKTERQEPDAWNTAWSSQECGIGGREMVRYGGGVWGGWGGQIPVTAAAGDAKTYLDT